MKLYDNDFSIEVKKLLSKVEGNKSVESPIIFYGSSTIRLWKSLDDDFKNMNVINLGFGGAYIHSLSKNFDLLVILIAIGTLFGNLNAFKNLDFIFSFLGNPSFALLVGVILSFRLIKFNPSFPTFKTKGF